MTAHNHRKQDVPQHRALITPSSGGLVLLSVGMLTISWLPVASPPLGWVFAGCGVILLLVGWFRNQAHPLDPPCADHGSAPSAPSQTSRACAIRAPRRGGEGNPLLAEPPAERETNRPYDVFLSYHAPDRAVVAHLAAQLSQAGLRPWFDQGEILAGQLWMQRVEQGLSQTCATVVIIGPHGLGRWQYQEAMVAIRLALQSAGDRPVIPVLLPGANRHNVPYMLDNFSWVEFTQTMDDETAVARLVSGILGHSRPTELPRPHLLASQQPVSIARRSRVCQHRTVERIHLSRTSR